MTAQSVETVVAQLANAGLNLSLAPAGGLAVAPASNLTADLRALIRTSKAQLICWLTAANDAAIYSPDPTDEPVDWKEMASTYYAHHFKCPTCITAGRGSHYGKRCGAGIALWLAYSTCIAAQV